MIQRIKTFKDVLFVERERAIYLCLIYGLSLTEENIQNVYQQLQKKQKFQIPAIVEKYVGNVSNATNQIVHIYSNAISDLKLLRFLKISDDSKW